MNRPDPSLPRLSASIADRLRLAHVILEPVGVKCAWPVYKAVSDGCSPFFVKVTNRAAAERTLEFLKVSADCPFLPRPICEEALDYDGFAVLCLEWKEARKVNAENMTEGQLGGFAEGCRMLSDALNRYTGPVAPLPEEDTPEGEHAIVLDYMRRHPLAGRLLKPLATLPAAERSYGSRGLVTIHSDLQSANYGFDGDCFAAVYDTDDLTKGLACEDATYAFTERMRRSELSAADRRRLTDLFLRLVAMSPWPREEWLIAINHSRLRIAACRLAKHVDSVLIAFDIARRDRPLRALAAAVKEGCA